MSNTPVPREFIAERDLRIFKAKQQGVSNHDIARKFGITTKAVATAVGRQLDRLNREAAMAYPEVLRMELERLEQLQQPIWPMTQVRQMTTDDGEVVELAPDLDATKTVLAIMAARNKLLGLDRNRVELQVETSDNVRSTLSGHVKESVDRFDSKADTLTLLRLMQQAGVIPDSVGDSLIKQLEDDGIVDAEIVEEKDE